MKTEIPLLRPYFDIDEVNEIRKVLDSGWVSQGPEVKEFEEGVKEFLGVKHAIALANCTCALHLALLSTGIRKGTEVLVADYTFPATGHAVLYCGGKPRFVDVDPKTYNIDTELIEAKIAKKTKAIIPVHTFGHPAEMDEIMRLADEHELKVIEDAACAFGAKHGGRYAGTFGDVGCFSFHARKSITTGEGGMAVTDDGALAEKIRHLSVFGMTTAWSRQVSKDFSIPRFVELGYNYKMSDIAAAVGVAQMRKLETFIKRKRKLARYWDDKLREIELIEPPYVSRKSRHVYQSYVALVDKRISRDKLILALMKDGIQTQIGTYASHIQPVYNSKDECRNSLDIFNRSLALPMYYNLDEADIDRIALRLKDAVRRLK